MYDVKWIRGEHIEVFLNGVFQFSADNLSEVREIIGDNFRRG